MIDKTGFGAARGHADFDLAFGFERQRFCQHLAAWYIVRKQDQARHRLVVIELRDETIEHVFDSKGPVGLRIVGAIAPVLAGAEEEHLNAGLPAVLMGCEHIGFFDAFRVDRLIGGHVRQRPQAVAEFCGLLELQFVGGVLHQALVHLAHVLAFAAQEAHRFVDGFGVVFKTDLERCTGPSSA